MPQAFIYLATKVNDEIKSEIAQESMKILAEVLGKPIIFCSAQIKESIGGFDGNIEPSAFLDVRSIGEITNQKDLSDKLCTLIESKTSIKGDKIYLNFTSLKGINWGHDHKTYENLDK